MTYQPMHYEKAVWAWLDLVLGADVTEIRFANQAAPRAKALFVTVQVLSNTANQTPAVVTADVAFDPPAAGYATQIKEHRVATVSLNVFGAGHRSMMARIERSIADPHVVDFNTARGLEVQEAIGSANDLSALLATEYEGRTQLDFRIAYTTQTDSPFATRIISSADISGLINDATTQQTEP